MKHIVTDYVSRLIEHKIRPVWVRLEKYAAMQENMKAEMAAFRKTIEEYGCAFNSINQVLEEQGTNLKNNNQALEEQGRNLKNNNQMLEEQGRNLKSNNHALEEYGQNLKNNNQDLEAYGRNLKKNNVQTEKLAGFYEQTEKISDKVDMLEIKLARLLKHPTAVPAGRKEMQPQAAVEKTENNYADIDYFDFANHFRGSREHVKDVQKIYLPYFKGCRNVLDLGCGRGEFLELLKENGIHALGVDLYEEFVEFCTMRGLQADCSDAIGYLEKVTETDGIFAAQLIEHLQTGQMIRLCSLAYEKLKKGCYAVFETPNPASLAIYTNSFYIDPSHEKPVHPLTMKYFMEKAGFKDIQIIYTQSSRIDVQIPKAAVGENQEEFNAAMARVQEVLFGSQDYALVARK